MCKRTCRDLFPNEPETWCSACVAAEAEDREANMVRWKERTRRDAMDRWLERFAREAAE